MDGLDPRRAAALTESLVEQSGTDGRVYSATDEHEDNLVPSNGPPDVVNALLLPFLQRKVAGEAANVEEEVVQHFSP